MPGGESLSGLDGSRVKGEVAQDDENRGGNRWTAAASLSAQQVCIVSDLGAEITSITSPSVVSERWLCNIDTIL